MVQPITALLPEAFELSRGNDLTEHLPPQTAVTAALHEQAALVTSP